MLCMSLAIHATPGVVFTESSSLQLHTALLRIPESKLQCIFGERGRMYDVACPAARYGPATTCGFQRQNVKH